MRNKASNEHYIPYAALLADWAFFGCPRVITLDALGVAVTGVSGSWPLRFFVFLVSMCKLGVEAPRPSSSTGISGSPDSTPSNVRKSSSRSFLKRLSDCSSRLSSTYSAFSSAICSGVRFSRLATYFLRVTSRSGIMA